jgi:hypothetical protein
MARFGKKIKERAVARLPPPEGAGISRVSHDLGVSVATLERSRADALSRPARERVWTASARLQAVITTAAMDEAQRNAWCREQGIFPTDLESWQETASAALSQPEKHQARPQQTREDRRRIKELERELRRKNKALAEAAALLVLQKKLETILRDSEEE